MKVLIAAGGTGGHIYPGIAVAKEILRRDETSEVLFVGTARGLETRIVPDNGFQLSLINSAGLKNVGVAGKKAKQKDDRVEIPVDPPRLGPASDQPQPFRDEHNDDDKTETLRSCAVGEGVEDRVARPAASTRCGAIPSSGTGCRRHWLGADRSSKGAGA